MSGRYLYCQNTNCGEYLGSLGGDACSHCGWQAGDSAAGDHVFAELDAAHEQNSEAIACGWRAPAQKDTP